MAKEPKLAENGDIEKRPTCGLIMPISSIDGCSAEHWLEVKSIITEAIGAIEEIDFQVALVSDQDDVGVIQSRIVQKIYESDIVVCDVSCKNPNVMFELGMRLAFDKPVVVIKDDFTDYSFDTSPLEHLNYPRDLRFSKILNFKVLLGAKVLATYQESKKPTWRSFLSNFASFKAATIDRVEVSSEQAAVLRAIGELSSQVSFLLNRHGTTVSHVTPASLYQNSPRPVMTKGAIMQMESAIRRFSIEHPEVPSDSRKGNSDFYRFVATHIPYQHQYQTFDDFISAVDSFMELHRL